MFFEGPLIKNKAETSMNLNLLNFFGVLGESITHDGNKHVEKIEKQNEACDYIHDEQTSSNKSGFMVQEESIFMIVTNRKAWVTHANIEDFPKSSLECGIIWFFGWIHFVLILNLISSEHVECNGKSDNHEDDHETKWDHYFHDINEDFYVLGEPRVKLEVVQESDTHA